jgi:predicted DsbA family dithiol-disulfide isomerase
MAAIDLYVDPVCPFGWVSAQWLLDAARQTGRQVTLRQMRLAVLNEGADLDARHQPMINRSRQLGRLFAAVGDRLRKAQKAIPETDTREVRATGTGLRRSAFDSALRRFRLPPR